MLHYGKNIINVELSNYKYFVNGGDTPTTRIDYYMGFSGEMTITVNGKFAPFNNELDLYFWFRTDPGDQFTVGVYHNPARGKCYWFSPLWLHCSNTGKKYKLCDRVDIGCWDEYGNGMETIYETNYTIPNI